MKKPFKILTAVMAVALVAALSIGGTLAYLTAQDEVKNTFTVGKVRITLDEAPVDETGKAYEGGRRVPGNSYTLTPGAVLDKDPTVTVLAGSEDCYVRALVTVNRKAVLDAIFADVPGHADLAGIFGGLGDLWTFAGQTTGEDTITYELRYRDLVPGASTDTVLQSIFTTVNVPTFLTNEDLAAIGELTIDVMAQAIQADTFENAEQAWKNF